MTKTTWTLSKWIESEIDPEFSYWDPSLYLNEVAALIDYDKLSKTCKVRLVENVKTVVKESD